MAQPTTREFDNGVTITSFGTTDYFMQRNSPPSTTDRSKSDYTVSSSSTSLASTSSGSNGIMDENQTEMKTSKSFSPSSEKPNWQESLGQSQTPMAWNKPEWNKGHPVVVLRDAAKSYGKKKVLSQFDMTIREGAIYGLLGASGCGKTTALSCIVGLKNLDSGVVSVFGGVPGDRSIGIPGKRVGYMSQDLALYGEFTIKETLLYFGHIYGMDRESIRDRTKFLIDFLDLPRNDHLIRILSGGQQRRVSFAVSLLHNPELLILDEPTVGVDPLLRQNIWSHLLQLVTVQRKTILITTHYIEEARQATTVGLMRHGHLLAEDSPSQLLSIYGLNTLEEVFLKLCVKEDSAHKTDDEDQYDKTITMLPFVNTSASLRGQKEHKRPGSLVYPGITASTDDLSIQGISYCTKNPSTKLPAEQAKIIRRQHQQNKQLYSNGKYDVEEELNVKPKSRCSCTMPSPTKLWALMMKNFTKMWRNLASLLFVFLLPAVEVLFFCVAIGRDPYHLPMAFVSHEMGNLSDVTNCTVTPGCEFNNLSCRLLSNLTNYDALDIQPFGTEEAALDAILDGKVWGMLVLEKNFSKALLNRLWSSLEADEQTRFDSSVHVRLDMSNQQVDFALQRAIHEGYSDFMSSLLGACNFPTDLADSAVRFGSPVYGPEKPNFTQFMAPGIIVIIIFFLAVSLTGESFINEKQDGLMDRSWVAGVLPIEILFSHILTQFVVLVGQTAITLVFILLVFAIPCEGPLGWLITLTFLQGLAGMCFGFLLSTLFNEQTTAMQCAIGSFYPMLMLSGILWPLEGMPLVMQKIAWFLPCTAACQGMRDIMARGWSIARLSVYMGIVASSSWIVIFIFASWIAMKLGR